MSSSTDAPISPAAAPEPDWAALFPADPELMGSAEGDAKGLADVQKTARARREGKPS